MNDPLQLGAIETGTNKYVSPTEASKGKHYTCIECNMKVILKKGPIRKAHFAHYSQTNICSYYDHPNESQIHKDAKMLMAKLLTDKKRIQFVWYCDYPQCHKTLSNTYELQEMPSIMHKEGDEIKMEYRDKDNKWVADIAIVNNGDVRYIIEIKNTHATTTARPEPWYEVNANEFIHQINALNMEHPEEPEIDEYKIQEDYIYYISCERTDIVRYCYGSFCYKESWVGRLPGYDKDLLINNCVLCETNDYSPAYDGATGRFTNSRIRVCRDCLFNDTTKKQLRKLYAPPCYGRCFNQYDRGYNQIKCPEHCKLIYCSKCSVEYPEWIIDTGKVLCIQCDMDRMYIIFLDVPYARKDEVKAYGAKWDPVKRKWFIHSDAKNKTMVLSKFKETK